MNATTHQRSFNGLGIIAGLILLILAVLAITALISCPFIQAPTIVAIKPIPKIEYQSHAVETHGSDALAIRKCLQDKGGADDIWRSSDKRTFYLLCQLPDGRWGFMAIVQDAINRLWYESTSFIKGDGTRNALANYLSKWGSKFKGPYPWQ
jgi:hypothetical protein